MSATISGSAWLEPLSAIHFAQSTMLTALMALILWIKRDDFRQVYYSLVVAITAYHAGASLAWGWRWLWRWSWNNRYHDLLDFVELVPVPMIAAVLMALGLAYKVKVLTQAGLGNIPWILFLVISIGFAFVVSY